MMSYARSNERFSRLTYESFRALARNPTLSSEERVGFPASYREGKVDEIFADIQQKLPNLSKEHQVVVDLGIGCGGLSRLIVEWCRARSHTLYAIDSPEMLEHLPDAEFLIKVPTYFPRDCRDWIEQQTGKVDILLCYSVFHYVFAEGNPFDFLDSVCALLAPGGEGLIGDIPNQSQRKRFFSSAAGIAYHQSFMGTHDVPRVTLNQIEPGLIDDAVLSALMMRCRAAGFDTYWMPQASALPMANRREDLLIRRA